MGVVLIGAAMQELFLRRMEHGLSEDEILADSSPAMRQFRGSTPKLAIATVTLCAVASIFTSSDYGWMYITFIPSWIVLAISIVNHKRMGAGFTRTGRVLLGVVRCCAFGHCAHRLAGAKPREQTGFWNHSKLGINDTSRYSNNETGSYWLRRFSTFAIAVDEARFVSIIPNDAILSARMLSKVGPRLSNACRWFNLGCPQVAPATVKPLPSRPDFAAYAESNRTISNSTLAHARKVQTYAYNV
jgi:hypothetical protein